MPLFKGKSKKDFAHNVKEEIHSGKEPKQALAIAYSMKRKKKASGGSVESGDKEMNYSKGGDVKGVHEPMWGNQGKSVAGAYTRDAAAMHEKNPNKAKEAEIGKSRHSTKLEELKEMPGPTSGKSGFAEGGAVDPMMEVECPSCSHKFSHGGDVEEEEEAPLLTDDGEQSDSHDMDMISRIMHKRKMSRGGQIDNEDKPTAEFEPNEFDDLAKEDGLEFHASRREG